MNLIDAIKQLRFHVTQLSINNQSVSKRISNHKADENAESMHASWEKFETTKHLFVIFYQCN